MTTEQSEIAITLLQSLLIQVDEATDSSALSSTIVLGRQERLAAYDAAYERVSTTIGIADRNS
ncbi:hypothetical protein [Microcoleus sp. D3_18a_C4]|uniref:hypothetical protein n=1 Tax=unclassified Microcoleus TaxID=2642155 RepID=UPI002FD5E044